MRYCFIIFNVKTIHSGIYFLHARYTISIGLKSDFFYPHSILIEVNWICIIKKFEERKFLSH